MMCAAIVQSPATTTEEIVGQIVDLIGQRELQVGDQLPPICELSKLLGQNATAVRHALLQAQAQGLVKVLPRAGAFVQKTSLKPDELKLDSLAADFGSVFSGGDHNLFHLLDARRLIEMELGVRAIRRREIEDLLPLRQTLEAMTSIPVPVHRVFSRHNFRRNRHARPWAVGVVLQHVGTEGSFVNRPVKEPCLLTP